jgi:hypothetical protein
MLRLIFFWACAVVLNIFALTVARAQIGVGHPVCLVAAAEKQCLSWSRKEFMANLEMIKGSIRESIARQPDLQPFQELLVMKLDATGLRLELWGQEEFGGSERAKPLTPTRKILEIIARELGRLPSHMIDVHVDSCKPKSEGWPPKALRGAVSYESENCRGSGVESLISLINEYACRFGVDPLLVKAVVRHESGFNPRAVSPKGAEGLMQLMPGTATSMGVRDSFDPEQNLAGGIGYLRLCLERFRHNVPLAIAAYNAGPAQVVRYGGIPPFPETQLFVQKVMRSYEGPSSAYLQVLDHARPPGRWAARHASPDLNLTIIEVQPQKNL